LIRLSFKAGKTSSVTSHNIAFTDLGDTTVTDATVCIASVISYNTLHLQANNNITVAYNTYMATDNSIHIETNNNIKLNGEVRTSNSGNIKLTADADADADGANGGNLTLTKSRRYYPERR
jgi:hypothetical protein